MARFLLASVCWHPTCCSKEKAVKCISTDLTLGRVGLSVEISSADAALVSISRKFGMSLEAAGVLTLVVAASPPRHHFLLQRRRRFRPFLPSTQPQPPPPPQPRLTTVKSCNGRLAAFRETLDRLIDPSRTKKFWPGFELCLSAIPPTAQS